MLHGKKIIAICTTKVNTPSANSLITHLNDRVREHGYIVFVYSTCSELYQLNPSDKGEESVFDLLDFNVIDILVVNYEKIKDRALSNEIIRRAREKGKPVFVINGNIDGCINVNFDYKAGFLEMSRHVIEHHGVKRPHFMAGFEGNKFSEDRFEMFRQVLAENNIPYDDSMKSYGDFWSGPTIAATEKLIETGKLPDAIICANDSMAVNVCGVLMRHGISVPDDIIVTGFDGIGDARVSNPTITTCMCSNIEIADRIADYIIEGDHLSDNFECIVTPKMELAQSCGCNPHITFNAADHLTMLNDRFNRYQSEELNLFEMVANIFTLNNINDVSDTLMRSSFFDLTCILYKECINEKINPLSIPKNKDEENVFVLFETDKSAPFEPYEFKRADLIPELDKLIEIGDPLIFVALNFINIPLGYVCFHYHNADMNNYYRVPQTVSILNNAIGGYRNMRFQQFLNARLEEIYKLDRLTGLFNRNALVNTFEETYDRMKNGDEDITFIISDLDRLKYINDTFGHTEGDYAIRAVADALRAAAPPHALLARWGGDEMVALFVGGCEEYRIKEDIRTYLEKLVLENNKPYEITSSIGIVTVKPSELTTLDDITKSADRLMYSDKIAKRKARI
ncbi:MAG: GGDEF domain-containing protein [Oscillospiraceae bacterium]|nr:GGDEF domain-containing protein [Oscillospiraceae bacterium]